MTGPDALAAFAGWCWNLPLSAAIRSAPWAYPVMETLHLSGTILVFGTVLILDLRLFGFLLEREPGARLAADLMRWAWLGFAVQLSSGPLLFIADAEKLAMNGFFRWKLALLAIAIVFHFKVVTNISRLPDPRLSHARLAAGVSLAFWSAAIISGFAIRLF